ncbi:tagatose-6-phosphate kinase [Echinicola pacifica]|uniref:Tagatose-6-phosphate kinase n=1 Tax=Echinicola pacifica TaxID=346377 RepID=A0A918UWQ5_9BACT|nr:PfkB family carbohydrate kinase [Echinicola pacifica]GGZ41144.1 tagatose-6-phosphate kinase [Echinicola pacifica]
MVISVCPNLSVDTYASLDSMELGKVNRMNSVQEFPGGKGTHVALAIAEFAGESSLLAFWGGATGQWMRQACEAYGVSTAGPVLAANNRKSYTFISANPSLHHTELLEPGPSISKSEFDQLIADILKSQSQGDVVVISGSWPKDSPENAYQLAVAASADAGGKVIVDCSGKHLSKALESKVFGMHLNAHEAEDICGSGEVEKVMGKLSTKVDLIAYTKGAEGLYLSYLGKIFHARLHLDEVISTVGCGDCLTAGIAYALDRGLSVAEIARYGVAFGAANCLRPELGMLHKSDVQKLLPMVEINELKYA